MLDNFKLIARRRFFALLGGSTILSVLGQRFLARSASAQTPPSQTAPAQTPASTPANPSPADTASPAMRTTSPSARGGDAIDILLADHRQIESYLNQISQTPATNPTQRAQLLQQLATLLTIHNATEENYIYPAIRDVARRPNDSATLYQQQDQAKVIMFELDQLAKNSPNWDSRFAALRTALMAHVAQEERTEFPQLRQAAGPKMTALTTKVRQLRSQFGSVS